MNTRMKWALLFAGLVALSVTAAEEPAKSGGELVVIDGKGQEHKLKTWKFTQGTRPLAWLSKGKPADGPEALEFREENSTNFADGVLTLVPLQQIRSLEYDHKADKAKLTVTTGPKPEDKVTLTGDTGFQGTTNKIIIEEGKDTKFLGGVIKDGINGVKFPASKVEALPPAGRPVLLTTTRSKSGKTEVKMSDIQPLYRFADGSEVLSPTLHTKTAKVDLAKVIKIARSAGADDTIVWVISAKKADDETLTLLQTVTLDGKEATLVGLVGRVPAGYRILPARIVQEIEFDVK